MLGFTDSYDNLRSVVSAEDHIVIFYHLHKTAGTTVEQALLGHYGNRALRCHKISDRLQILEALRSGTLPAGPKLIYGHSAASMAEDLGQFGYTPGHNLFRFTFLRHPVSRIESYYAFMKLRDLSMTEDLAEFVGNFRRYSAARHFLKGMDPGEWLRSGIDFIGLCEDFERSAALLFQILDIPVTSLRSRNVNTSDKERMSPDLVATAMTQHSRDFLLYEMAAAAWRTARDAHLTRKPIEYRKKAASVARQTKLNTNLEDNKDVYSLFLTGMSLYEQDPATALPFFEKTIRLNLRFAGRIRDFLAPRDKAALVRIRTVAAEHYDAGDGEEVAQLLNLLT